MELSPALKKHKPIIDNLTNVIKETLDENEILRYKDVFYTILTFLNGPDIAQLEQTNKIAKDIIRSYNVWRVMMQKDYPDVYTLNQIKNGLLVFRLRTAGWKYWKRMYEVVNRNLENLPRHNDEFRFDITDHDDIFGGYWGEYDNQYEIVQAAIEYPTVGNTVCFFVDVNHINMMRIYKEEEEEMNFEIVPYDDTTFSLNRNFRGTWHIKNLQIARIFERAQQSIAIRVYDLLEENYDFLSKRIQ